MDLYLEAGADINALAPYAGFEINALTALTCWHDEIDKPKELAEWLLDNGAKIECQGRSAFLWAIWFYGGLPEQECLRAFVTKAYLSFKFVLAAVCWKFIQGSTFDVWLFHMREC